MNGGGLVLIPFALASFELSPTAQAQLPSPIPDGSYPSDNTANGAAALSHNTTAGRNTANGFEALANNSTGGNNTAEGHSALINNTTGSNNIAIPR